MAKYVPDVTTNRWIVIAESRLKRPKDTKPSPNAVKVCIFCPGMEKIPGEEIFRLGAGAAYEPGWKVRVIKNKYPITDFHEVIIHSPDDIKDIDQLQIEQVVLILKTFRNRFNANKENGHVLIFNNVGEAAGASIRHPHSQLVVVPKQINLDSLTIEPTVNLVRETNSFSVFCPDFSQWPYETWISPKKRNEMFGDIADDAIIDLAGVLQDSLKRLVVHLSTPSDGESHASHLHPGVPAVSFKEGVAYNFYIHFSKDWYIRIIPRLIHRAGFELGTGISVNIVDPADAAAALREEKA